MAALLLIGALAAIGLQPAARAGWAGGSIRMDLSLTRDHELQRARDAVAHAAAQLVLNEHPSEYTSASSELTTAQRHEAASQRHEAASQLTSQLRSTPPTIPNARWLSEITSCGLVAACLLCSEGTPLVSVVSDAVAARAADADGHRARADRARCAPSLAFATRGGGTRVVDGEVEAVAPTLGAADRSVMVVSLSRESAGETPSGETPSDGPLDLAIANLEQKMPIRIEQPRSTASGVLQVLPHPTPPYPTLPHPTPP